MNQAEISHIITYLHSTACIASCVLLNALKLIHPVHRLDTVMWLVTSKRVGRTSRIAQA